MLFNSYVFLFAFLPTVLVVWWALRPPTVRLTFDIQFKPPVYGRHLIVEAAASDDFGHLQDFAFAGRIDVLDKPAHGP